MTTSSLAKDDIIQRQILLAARRLFQVHGLQKVTMDDVAKAIGKGRSSLYYYYKSKDEIFEAVIALDIREMLAAITKAVEKASTTEQKIKSFCESKLLAVREKRSFYIALDAGMDANTLSNFNKAKIAHHNLIMQKEGALLIKILKYGVTNGELLEIDKNNINTLIFVLLSSLHGLKREMLMDNSFDKIEPAVNTLTNLIMNGLKE